MDKRERVIKGLETCIPMKYETNEEKECRHEQCPYGRENYKPTNGCLWDLMADALELLFELLNEKQPKKVAYIINPWTKLPVSHCPRCNEPVDRTAYGRDDKEQKYCPYCGQSIDWNGGEQE